MHFNVWQILSFVFQNISLTICVHICMIFFCQIPYTGLIGKALTESVLLKSETLGLVNWFQITVQMRWAQQSLSLVCTIDPNRSGWLQTASYERGHNSPYVVGSFVVVCHHIIQFESIHSCLGLLYKLIVLQTIK